MADIRIKDLTTTASSTASDDFIAVDGTTNGTRKLNAFSPTFGGNATVTGTLTVNNPVVAQGTAITGYQFLAKDTGGTAVGAAYALQTSGGTDKWRWGLRGSAGSLTDSLIFSYLSGSWSDALTLSNAGVVSIPSTTASTTTSSGALVVGNGTSGGLGVGGNITLGGGVNIAGSASDPLPINTSGLWTLAGSGLRINSAGYTFASLTGTSVSTATFTLNGTTASTSTSSGALVVSGGVGVAGAVNAGTFYGLVDGVTAPATESGYARIYVDSADGDLKVKFGDGTVKTIATDS